MEVDVYLGFHYGGTGSQEVTDQLPDRANGFDPRWQLIDSETNRAYSVYSEGITGLCAGGEGSLINSPVFTIRLDAVCFDSTLQGGACYAVPNLIPWYIAETNLGAPLILRYTDTNRKAWDIDLDETNGTPSPPTLNATDPRCQSTGLPGQGAPAQSPGPPFQILGGQSANLSGCCSLGNGTTQLFTWGGNGSTAGTLGGCVIGGLLGVGIFSLEGCVAGAAIGSLVGTVGGSVFGFIGGLFSK